jgi:hypothetical protein
MSSDGSLDTDNATVKLEYCSLSGGFVPRTGIMADGVMLECSQYGDSTGRSPALGDTG